MTARPLSHSITAVVATVFGLATVLSGGLGACPVHRYRGGNGHGPCFLLLARLARRGLREPHDGRGGPSARHLGGYFDSCGKDPMATIVVRDDCAGESTGIRYVQYRDMAKLDRTNLWQT